VERARDRRRCQGEIVGHGTRFLAQPRSLRDAETLLLVDDREAEVVHDHGVFNQRVRADDERVVTSSHALQHLASRGS
jgi:hypothetical protein